MQEEQQKEFLCRWLRSIYAKRTYDLLKRRTGIDVKKQSRINYMALLRRLRRLSVNGSNYGTYISESMKQHLCSLPRNENGLTNAEQVLFDRLFKGEWYLIHMTLEETLAKIKENNDTLLSVEELTRRGIASSYSSINFIDEISDGIFCSISPGRAQGRPKWGKCKIIINLNEININSIRGAFSSGCIYRFHYEKPSKKSTIRGTVIYNTHKQVFNQLDGLQYLREYRFEQPSGEVSTLIVNRFSEIFSLPIMRQALCYKVVEGIRLSGLGTWQDIYKNIETIRLDEIQEIARIILSSDVIEVHIPRTININQPGISIKHLGEEDLEHRADGKIVEVHTIDQRAEYDDPYFWPRYTFLFQGQDPKTHKIWYLLDDANHKQCTGVRQIFSIREDCTSLEPLDVCVNSKTPYTRDLETLVNIVASNYYAVKDPAALQLIGSKHYIEDGSNGETFSHTIIAVTIIDQTQNERLMKEFSTNILYVETEKQTEPLAYSFACCKSKSNKEVKFDKLQKAISIIGDYPKMRVK